MTPNVCVRREHACSVSRIGLLKRHLCFSAVSLCSAALSPNLSLTYFLCLSLTAARLSADLAFFQSVCVCVCARWDGVRAGSCRATSESEYYSLRLSLRPASSLRLIYLKQEEDTIEKTGIL